MKNALVIEDLSSLNSISMNVAGPIIASYGLRALQIPVQNFITQTESDSAIESSYSIDWLKTTLKTAHQQFKTAENIGLIGYLGKKEIIDLLLESKLKNDFQLLLVDPAMADNGAYYPLLDADYCSHLRDLLPFADIITPNLTELAFLTDTPYSANIRDQEIAKMVAALRSQTKTNQLIIVTGIEKDDQVGCYWDDGVSCGTYFLRKVSGHFYGTGDAFAAALLGELSNHARLVDCLPEIMNRMRQCVEATLLDGNDLKLGIEVTPLICRKN